MLVQRLNPNVAERDRVAVVLQPYANQVGRMRLVFLGDVRGVENRLFVLHANSVLINRHFRMRHEAAVDKFCGRIFYIVSLPCFGFERGV